MKSRMLKNILPALLVCGLCGGMFGSAYVSAQEHGNVGHGEMNSGSAAVVQEGAGHASASVGHMQDSIDSIDHAQDNTHIADASGEEAHAEGHGGEHAGSMLTWAKLKDLFWRALNFAGLVFLIVKFGGKPIAAFLGGRRSEIEDDLKTVRAQRDEAESSYKEFEMRLAGMEEEMADVVDKALAMAEEEKNRILAKAEASAAEIKRQSKASVQDALAKAQKKLQAEVAEQAVAMAEELIVKNLTTQDQVAITEQYLERVGAVQ